MRKASRKAAFWVLLPAVVTTACSDGNVASAQTNGGNTQQQVREQLGPVPATLDTAAAARLSSAFRGAADRALPAVVQIRVTQTAPRQQVVRSFPFNIPGFPEMDPQTPERGTGSGVIFDKTGYILTNNHVVGGADQVTVTLPDGRVFDARVIGTDPETDVGVIKIEPGNAQLPVATLGSSDALNIGDWVLALGNPLGLEFTVTAGIVSAKGRQLGIVGRGGGREQQQRSLEAFIQTDAAINPGNSGGPLVDLMGRVVGINTAIQSPTGYYSGAGFAIPIELARKVAGDLIEFGVVHRPRLGVTVASVDEADAEVYKLPEIAGAELSSVDPQSPAGRAGLRRGDVIVSMDGRDIRSNVQLMAELARKRPGDKVQLGYIRYGQRGTATVELGQFDVERPAPQARAPKPEGLDLLGFRVSPLTPDLARQFRLDPRVARNQVVITEVTGTHARDANVGISEVVSINGQKVDSVRDVERIANSLRPGQVISLVYRPLVGDLDELIVNYRAPR